ncbi:hypothetical protein BJF79_25290 [Actinomadura sp. CNU-125]|uniref:DUF4352 domain-containing protein n=1 Tax=Actinomadura sp. CNU-125 TaxID=1904961 RepID=UPI00095FDA3D|nr:DUF4352 domain-containing protein [Actinomadura sp. CNU-125]OLT10885.1 hypothetical protein BJF79_25290 [Actinomadura sp. CNU-125]
MSDPQVTRPDPVGPDGWPFIDESAGPAPQPIGVVRRILQAFGAIAGVQFLAAAIALLVLTSYRRAAADWLLPLLAVADLLVSVQIGWLAIRDIRLAGRRTAWPRFVLTFLVVAFLVGAGGAGHAVNRYLNRPVEAAFDSSVTDGDVRFTVSAPECGRKVKRIVVRGVMCRIRLTVANAGSAEARFDARIQRLHGDGAEHLGVLLAKGRTTRAFWALQAGASVRGYLVFDVPHGFVPRALDLHAADGSRGLRFSVS